MTVATIDFGGTAVKLGVYKDGRLAAAQEVAIEDGRVELESVARRVQILLGGDRPTAVGIAVPGIVDQTGTRMVAAHGKYANLHDVDLNIWSAGRFGCPAIVENDARAALIGEVTDGIAAGARDAAIIVLGTGIGTAAMVNGRLVRGSHGHAAILGGHVTVDLDGPRCPCGNIGCAEALASTWALGADVTSGRLTLGPETADREQDRRAVGIRELLMYRHQPEFGSLLDRYLAVWAAVIVTYCHAFDPEVVVVSGGVMRAAELILPALRDRVHADLWSSSFRPPFVVPSDPTTSVLRGVAVLATQLAEGQ